MKRSQPKSVPNKGKKCVTKTGKLELTHSLEIETESQRVALHGLLRLLILNHTTDEDVPDEQPQNV